MSATKKPLTFDMDRSPRTPVERSDDAAETRQQMGTRISVAIYRQLKARAAMRGEAVQDLVELAIAEFLANHPQ